MSEYIKQAEKFASENNVKLTILDRDYKDFWNEGKKRFVFKCKLTRGKKSYTFEFGQSMNEGASRPTMYDILACLTKYDVGSYEDFCSEFGYSQFDENTGRKDKQTVKTYKAVCKEFEAVDRLFGDIIDQLQEIQ